MADLKKEDTLWKTLTDYRASLPKADNDGFEIQKVLCKDGKFDTELSSPNVRIDTTKTCINNGGRAENQTTINSPALGSKSSSDSIIQKLAGAYNQNLIIAVVLVAGYFAYKKFKK
jgi:hypothetical protein